MAESDCAKTETRSRVKRDNDVIKCGQKKDAGGDGPDCSPRSGIWLREHSVEQELLQRNSRNSDCTFANL